MFVYILTGMMPIYGENRAIKVAISAFSSYEKALAAMPHYGREGYFNVNIEEFLLDDID